MKTPARLRFLCSILIIPCATTVAVDNPHFWRATNFLPQFHEPRLAEAWLTSFDITLGTGHTSNGKNGANQKTELLDIYGFENAAALGINVPGKSPTNPLDIALNQVAALLPQPTLFGMLSYRGEFSIFEANISFSQNLCQGFFVQAHLPLRHFKVKDIAFVDLTPAGGPPPNQQTPAWQQFLNLYPAILQQYQVSTTPIHHTGAGDLSLYAGWTCNYEDTQDLDYIDTSLRIGIMLPTGATRNEDYAFDIANGYNGHTGFPIRLDSALGVYEWLTAGVHLNIIVFNTKNRTIRLTTASMQSGFIELAKAPATVKLGNIWEANVYGKADHIVGGLSFILGYNIAYQEPSHIIPNQPIFSTLIADTNAAYKSWSMHTLNSMIEYDFSSCERAVGPRVGFFYNIVMSGKRIFNTNMVGGQAGFDLSWHF